MMDSTSRALPTGGCNYRDLAQAGIALTCGCQRFWSRKRIRGKITPTAGERNRWSVNGKEISRIGRLGEGQDGNRSRSSSFSFAENGSGLENSDEECQCGHHACFHSDGQPVFRYPLPPPSICSQSPGRRSSLQISEEGSSLRVGGPSPNQAASGFSITSGTTTERDSSVARSSQSALATRPSRKNQPSQLGPDFPTNKSNSQVTIRGRGDGLEGLLQEFQSILEKLVSIEKQASKNSPYIAEINSKLDKLVELSERLEKSSNSNNERLETIELFGTTIEEIRDKMELTEDCANNLDRKIFSFENRLDDRLDDRFGEVKSSIKKIKEKRRFREKESNEDGSLRVSKRCRKERGNDSEALPGSTSQYDIKPGDIASFNTNTSASSSICTPTSPDNDSRFTPSYLERLDSRMVQIERNAPPSPELPWAVEVVLLPPAPLRGLWNDGTERNGGYESSNPQSVSTFSGATTRKKPNDFSDGPIPRSFGVNSRLYRRLGTRGFVKYIHVLGPTAHHVAAAVDLNFGKLITWCHSFYTPDERASTRPPTQYGGVSLEWQPLRKVHKQTNLEFLKPGEMMEVMWNVEFLKGSCIMKGRRAVLYITPLPPHSPTKSRSGISWKNIKDLPECIAGGEANKDTTKTPVKLPQPDVEDDDCWAWREALDEASESDQASSPGRSVSPKHSWSSFGPFQMEEEARALQALNEEEEELQKKTPAPTQIFDSGFNDCQSSGSPLPIPPSKNKKGKYSPLLREEIDSRDRRERARSSRRKSNSAPSTGKNESWKYNLSALSTNWQESPRTPGWLEALSDAVAPESLEEKGGFSDNKESNGSGDDTSEDVMDVE